MALWGIDSVVAVVYLTLYFRAQGRGEALTPATNRRAAIVGIGLLAAAWLLIAVGYLG